MKYDENIEDYYKIIHDEYGNMFMRKRIFNGRTNDNETDMAIHHITALWATDPDKKPRSYGFLIKTPKGNIYSRNKSFRRKVFNYDFPVRIVDELLPKDTIFEVHDSDNKANQQICDYKTIIKMGSIITKADRIVKRTQGVKLDKSDTETFFSISVDLYIVMPDNFRVLTGQYAL